MNNKGQSLTIFIIVFPIILILFGIVIEQAYILYNKTHIENVTKNIINNCIDRCEKDDIIKLYDKNNIVISDIEVSSEDGCEIKLETTIKSYLKSILDTKDYQFKIDLKGTKVDDKIKYEEGS